MLYAVLANNFWCHQAENDLHRSQFAALAAALHRLWSSDVGILPGMPPHMTESMILRIVWYNSFFWG